MPPADRDPRPEPPRRAFAFPRRRPQLFAETGRALVVAARYYAYGRPLPRWQPPLIEAVLRMPGARRLLAGRTEFRPPPGWNGWHAIASAADTHPGTAWAFFVPTWRTDRFGAFPIDPGGAVSSFVHATAGADDHPYPAASPDSPFRIPRVVQSVTVAGWSVRVVDAVPPRLGAPHLDAAQLAAVAAGIRTALAGWPAPAATPARWQPVHGDLTPWNLRAEPDGTLWLLDWEAAGWGPPGADVLHYRLAEASLAASDPDDLVRRVTSAIGDVDGAAARYWLDRQANEPDPGRTADRGRRADLDRRDLVQAALRRLATR